MKTVSLAGRLEEIAGIKVRTEVPLARLTTFKIGGPAAVVVTPETVAGLQQAMKVLTEAQTPLFILGNGSNLLISDEGYDGVVIRVGSALGAVAAEGGDKIRIGAGALWSVVLRFIQKEGWSGLEFGAGIPGTLGGAISTNAGTRGGETFDSLIEITGVDRTGEVRTMAKDSITHRYRSADLPENFVVTETLFRVAQDDPAKVSERIRGYQAERRRDQPEREPSAGCIFKNPPGGSAGKLIDVAGLKGEHEGGAVISPIHGNFIINQGGATAGDVLRLIDRIRARVQKEFSVDLELEVRKLGFE
ncbi:MAG TPA: UDP-N-acetylmuramate dehydrogenase [bacterium]|nr:UDP-N-acetylmuramate dehydrogenase [bacterium]